MGELKKCVPGSNRSAVPVMADNMDAWLDIDQSTIRDVYAILDGRERPYYENRLAP